MSKLCLKFEYYSHCDPYTTGNEMVSSIFLYVMIKICILWENVPMKNQWISSLSLKCESCLLVALACKLSVSFRMKKDLIWRINALQKLEPVTVIYWSYWAVVPATNSWGSTGERSSERLLHCKKSEAFH